MNRNITMDIARGIAIICIITVHFLSWWNRLLWLNRYIGMWVLILFFVVSGYFFKTPKNNKEYIIKRAKKILLPYVIYEIIFFIYYFNHNMNWLGIDHIEAIKRACVSFIVALPKNFESVSIFNTPTVGVGPIWFFVCLFVTNIFYLGISRTKYKLWIGLGLAILAQITQTILVIPFNIQDAFIGCFFMAIGDCGRKIVDKYLDKLKQMHLKYNFAILLVQIPIYYFAIMHLPYQILDLGSNVYHIFSSISSVIGISLILCLSVIIERTKIIDNFLSIYGRDSLVVIVLHSIDILIFRQWGRNPSWEFLIATIVGYYFINYLYNKAKDYYLQFKKIKH